jgi:hypothetical protein
VKPRPRRVKLRAAAACGIRRSSRVRIAKPILMVSTPIGVGWGLYEAAKVRWWLGVLMGALVAVIGLFFWLTVSRIRRERDAGR